jgi:nitrite reductase (NADH) small subunit
MTAVPITRTGSWAEVCAYDDLLPERGVGALIGDQQVALFRTYDGELYAVGNLDPFSGAYVLSRGIVGSRGNAPTVASPMYKEVFDLRTGVCLNDRSVRIPTYQVERIDGLVRIRAEPT